MDLAEYIARTAKGNFILDPNEMGTFDTNVVIAVLQPEVADKKKQATVLKELTECLICKAKNTDNTFYSPYVLFSNLIILSICFCSEECLSLYCLRAGVPVSGYGEGSGRQESQEG